MHIKFKETYSNSLINLSSAIELQDSFQACLSLVSLTQHEISPQAISTDTRVTIKFICESFILKHEN